MKEKKKKGFEMFYDRVGGTHVNTHKRKNTCFKSQV